MIRRPSLLDPSSGYLTESYQFDDPDGMRTNHGNPNHYRFVRESGLRRSDFARESLRPMRILCRGIASMLRAIAESRA